MTRGDVERLDKSDNCYYPPAYESWKRHLLLPMKTLLLLLLLLLLLFPNPSQNPPRWTFWYYKSVGQWEG